MNNQLKVSDAIEQLKKGGIILIFDDDNREAETDLVIASQHVTSESIRTFRKEGGGLICTTVPPELRNKLELPYLYEVFYNNGHPHPALKDLAPNDIPYDEISSFSITVNHRRTFTGITDNDRALTIKEFANLTPETVDLGSDDARRLFGEQFRSPGHVHLLIASNNLLEKRFGHTELSTAMMIMAELIPSATICEMMGDDGNSLPKERAREYGDSKNLPFIEGKDIIEAWKKWSK